MTLTSDNARGLDDQFLSYLITLVSTYELCPLSTPPPRYDGPSNWQTDFILRSLSAVARRMYTAENALASIKASESWQGLGPATKKGRSVVNIRIPYLSPSQDHTPSSPSQPNKVTTKQAHATHGGGSSNRPGTNSKVAGGVADVEISVSVKDAMAGVADVQVDRAPSRKPISSRRGVQNMSLSLANIPSNFDPVKLQRTFSNGLTSVPCGNAITDTMAMSCTCIDGSFNGSPYGSLLVGPPGPLAAVAFESGMSAVEELRLLKAQVQDATRVCSAVARGDLSQKITVPVQGVIMVELKDVINTMVEKLDQFTKAVMCVGQKAGVTDGNLGGQAFILDVEGTWGELTGIVNKLAANFTIV